MLEANAYMLSQKVLAKCEQANYSTVLYFYNNSNCPNCTQQGYELLDVKKQLGDGLRVYSFDGGLGSDIVDMLELRYNVTTYPSLVIDGNQTYPGFRTGDWIGAQLNATVQNMGTANSTDPNAGAAATTRIG